RETSVPSEPIQTKVAFSGMEALARPTMRPVDAAPMRKRGELPASCTEPSGASTERTTPSIGLSRVVAPPRARSLRASAPEIPALPSTARAATRSARASASAASASARSAVRTRPCSRRPRSCSRRRLCASMRISAAARRPAASRISGITTSARGWPARTSSPTWTKTCRMRVVAGGEIVASALAGATTAAGISSSGWPPASRAATQGTLWLAGPGPGSRSPKGSSARGQPESARRRIVVARRVLISVGPRAVDSLEQEGEPEPCQGTVGLGAVELHAKRDELRLRAQHVEDGLLSGLEREPGEAQIFLGQRDDGVAKMLVGRLAVLHLVDDRGDMARGRLPFLRARSLLQTRLGRKLAAIPQAAIEEGDGEAERAEERAFLALAQGRGADADPERARLHLPLAQSRPGRLGFEDRQDARRELFGGELAGPLLLGRKGDEGKRARGDERIGPVVEDGAAEFDAQLEGLAFRRQQIETGLGHVQTRERHVLRGEDAGPLAPFDGHEDLLGEGYGILRLL